MIDGTLVAVSEKRSTNPLLQILCKDRDGVSRGVTFYAKDAANHPPPDQMAKLEKTNAIKACASLISVKLASPVTISPATVEIREASSGMTILKGNLVQKNNSLYATCSFKGNDLVSGSTEPNGERHAL